ncbi:MAG: hypothetical protein HN929_12565 [Chloroflexi bacterium]|mgnify:CR=1 FL=1|jgi:hypothetical protein|nr:hypothetical protein [Chloroflexota bacterium]
MKGRKSILKRSGQKKEKEQSTRDIWDIEKRRYMDLPDDGTSFTIVSTTPYKKIEVDNEPGDSFNVRMTFRGYRMREDNESDRLANHNVPQYDASKDPGDPITGAQRGMLTMIEENLGIKFLGETKAQAWVWTQRYIDASKKVRADKMRTLTREVEKNKWMNQRACARTHYVPIDKYK